MKAIKEDEFRFGKTLEVDKRKLLVEEFYNHILTPDEIPYLVTDEATLYAFFEGDEKIIINKCLKYYQVKLSIDDLNLYFWQLLDKLNANRK